MDPVTIVEVGPRDGFQSVPVLIPTDTKIAIVRALGEAGLRRIEINFLDAPVLFVVPQDGGIHLHQVSPNG